MEYRISYKRIMDETDNSRVYKIALYMCRTQGLCRFCPINKGCNAGGEPRKDYRCWKRYRKTQYKNVNKF